MSPPLKPTRSTVHRKLHSWTFLPFFQFFGGGIYAPDPATYDPIEILLNAATEDERDELTARWRDNKLSELNFVGVVAALLAGVLTSTGSWPSILPSGELSPWPIRTTWMGHWDDDSKVEFCRPESESKLEINSSLVLGSRSACNISTAPSFTHLFTLVGSKQPVLLSSQLPIHKIHLYFSIVARENRAPAIKGAPAWASSMVQVI
ncbi:hypothetical protein E8E13_003538 [Curvularia kusanoi]|uniref:Uncharacterized protein n=1 Tax=Curvularia kusanoi TaxID=90978 RepID=A0A9P4WAC2_CURKU|nr:hypothetical protein E8E13_003538 [Curvularia kusanoi]